MKAIELNSIDYDKGYTHGYKDGVLKAYEQFKDALACQQVKYLVVTQEQFDKLKETGKL